MGQSDSIGRQRHTNCFRRDEHSIRPHEPSDDSGADTSDVELELVHTRVENAIDRLLRVIQFDLVALSVVVTVLQFGGPERLSPDSVVQLAAASLLSSVGIVLAGVTTNATPSDWPTDGAGRAALATEHGRRLTSVQLLVPLAYVTGFAGTVMAGVSVVRRVGIDRSAACPSWGSRSRSSRVSVCSPAGVSDSG